MTSSGQHVPGGGQQHGARRGQLHPVPAAGQQRRADELFQLPDLLAEGRLGDEQLLRGTGEGTAPATAAKYRRCRSSRPCGAPVPAPGRRTGPACDRFMSLTYARP